MADGLDTSSFDFYEGIRIFLPGALALGLAEGVNKTFQIANLSFLASAVSAVVGAVLLGLLFYYVDAPARAAVFYSLMPTRLLEGWPGKPKHGGLLNTYFIMLDADVPAPIRARALYMGSMYRIGYEAVVLTVTCGCVVMSSSCWSLRSIAFRGWRPHLGLMVAGFVLALGLVAVAVRRDGFKGKSPRGTDSGTKGRSVFDVVIVLVGIAFYAVATLLRGPGAVLLIPQIGLVGLWIFRYQRGYGRDRYRLPTTAAWSLILASIAFIMCVTTAATVIAPRAPRMSAVSPFGWLVCAGVGLLLLCARGHERRLRGAYSSQNTWLEMNQESMSRKYFRP